jgi:RNA polymerase sigma-70 factor (ECF subfamily)
LLTAEDISKLLARVALRDRRAFDALYEHTSAKLFGVALRLLKDRAEAEDALQEIYIKVWQRAETYALSQASAISWLVAIARNHAVDRLPPRTTPGSTSACSNWRHRGRMPFAAPILTDIPIRNWPTGSGFR